MKKLLLTLTLTANIASAQVFEVPAPKKAWFASSEPTKTLYRATADSQGVLLFIPGGAGQLKLDANRSYPERWWGPLQNYATKTSKVPMDLVIMESPYPVNWQARGTSDHIDRIRSVIEEYRTRTGKPVYLYGHSNGSISISEFLNKDEEHAKLIAGAIYTGNTTVQPLRTKINLPVLVLHHEKDACPTTPLSGAHSFYEEARSRNSNRTVMRTVSGGTNEDDVCYGFRSTHAFWGQHDQVSNIIDEFLTK